MDCVYLDPTNHNCLIKQTEAACSGCSQYLRADRRSFLRRWVDPLRVLGRDGHPTTALRDMLSGRSVFLLGGGPSANDLPLSQLAQRGVWTMAVNNAAGHPSVRPQAMICADPPNKFSHSVWLDPGIMKFIPTAKRHRRRGRLRRKVSGGGFEPLGITTLQAPNVWVYERNAWLWPDDRWFRSSGACWGNHAAGCLITGEPKGVCTMLLALRVLRYLGARRVFLLGVDFHMAAGYGYSFGQERDRDAVATNNDLFRVVNEWCCQLQRSGTFQRFGLEVFNCFERSGLRAFPYVPFDEAIIDVRGVVEQIPDLSGWYEK